VSQRIGIADVDGPYYLIGDLIAAARSPARQRHSHRSRKRSATIGHWTKDGVMDEAYLLFV